jgi:hypothetical protein
MTEGRLTGRSRFLSRGGRIRTGDPLLPKQVRYRTAPRPEDYTYAASCESAS